VASLVIAESSSMRKIPRVGEVAFLVIQQDNSLDINYSFQVTTLLLLP